MPLSFMVAFLLPYISAWQLIERQGRCQIKTASNQRKILFVTPPYHSGVDEIAGRWLPLGLLYLAAAARQAAVTPLLYDAMTRGDSLREVEEHLRERAADYVAVTAITATASDAVAVLELAKKARPDCVTILGGVHPTFMYRELLAQSTAIDYIVIGEGEQTLRHLLETLEQGGDPASVPGLAFRGSGTTVITGRRPLTENLDELRAAWDLVDWDDYTSLVIPGSRLGAISTSRGCSHDCTFCSQQRFWEKSWRARAPEAVADELAHLYTTYRVNVFLITDEHPTKDRERWLALLTAVIARRLPIHLLMETRVSDIIRDQDLLTAYRDAGVVYISLGAESSDQQRLDALRKGTQRHEITRATALLRDHEIVSEASFILGFPDETQDSIRRTMELVQECSPDIANFFIYTPWPYDGSQAADDYRKYNMVDPVCDTAAMTRLQIEVAQADCYRRFYMGKVIDFMTMKAGFRRDFLMRITKLFMGSSFVIRKLGVGIFGRFPGKSGEMRKGSS